MIPYGRQEITDEDIEAVVKVLRSDYLTQGPTVGNFEVSLANYCKAKHAVAVNSGTSALHIACLALGLGKGDLLWTSPISFVASANCARFCGADVDFVDIDPKTYNMSPIALEQKFEIAAAQNRLPKIIVPVHFGGQSCDMAAIKQLADKYGTAIIEDGCHAIGGKYDNDPVGSCSYSDITVFSFHPVKIITTAEGGAAVTNSNKIAEKLKLYSSHCITRNDNLMTTQSHGAWYYQQLDLGFNYRLNDVQAALGLSQLSRLDEVVTKRQLIAKIYDEKLAHDSLTLPHQHPRSYSSYHLYVIRYKQRAKQPSHKEVFNALRRNGIGVNLHYIPIHLQPYYQNLGFQCGDFPEAERYYEEAITLPLFHHLNQKDQEKVCNCVMNTLNG